MQPRATSSSLGLGFRKNELHLRASTPTDHDGRVFLVIHKGSATDGPRTRVVGHLIWREEGTTKRLMLKVERKMNAINKR